MNITSISDENLLLETDRLDLEPITPAHAEEMLSVLADKELYYFIPQNPPTLPTLQSTYLRWSHRFSPDRTELWLNWVARTKESKQLIGHFQATFKSSEEVSIAWIVGIKHQRKGFAEEALNQIIDYLRVHMQAKRIKAWIDTRNFPSINLAKKLNMKEIQYIPNADHFKGSESHEYVFQKTL